MDPTREPFIVKEAIPFVAGAGFLTLFAAASGWSVASGLLLLFTLAVAAFFRNPLRIVPDDPRVVISPADGRVLKVEPLEEDNLIQVPGRKVSIFMSPLNVHVNRIPFAGTVRRKTHLPGRFYVASQPKASLDNERTELILETDDGLPLGVVQIAGRLARRIICYAEPGERWEWGARYGLIRFGSRVEVLLPHAVQVEVREGDRVKGGSTILGRLP